MGKYKKSKKGRPRPTGLPSVQEAQREQVLEAPSQLSSPLLDKLISQDVSEKEVACRSLSYLMSDPAVREELMRGRVVRRVGPLMVDSDFAVREAAAGALRNWSLIESTEFFDQMVQEDLMTPLSSMLQDCLTQLVAGGSSSVAATEESPARRSESKGIKSSADKRRVQKEQVFAVLEQGLHLLWNISERHSLVVEVFNREGLLSVLLHLLQPAAYPMEIVLVAARCLHTITEDNSGAIQLLCSSREYLNQLESLLTSNVQAEANGRSLLLKTCIAGVFQNLLSGQPDPLLHSDTLRGVLSLLATVLDTDVSPLLHTLSATPPPSPEKSGDVSSPASKKEQFQAARKESERTDNLMQMIVDTLSAHQLAMEILANVCYTEGSEDGEEWEDEDGDVEEVIGGEDCDTLMETESEEQGDQSTGELSPAIAAVVELGLHEKVWKKARGMDSAAFQACTDSSSTLAEKLRSLHASSLGALQNLVAALPVSTWGGAGTLAAIWSSLLELIATTSYSYEAVVGSLLALINKLSSSEIDFMTVEQLQQVAQLGLTSDEPSVRADVMVLLGIAGRLALKHQALGEQMLKVVGACLRDCISTDSSLWVAAQALDSVFDVFGDDNCPPGLFASIALMPVLKQMASTFKARLRVGKKFLGPHLRLVQNTRVNLPRFIDYMGKRVATTTT